MTIREGHFKSTQCEKRARFDSSLMDLTGLELWQKVASTSKKNYEQGKTDTEGEYFYKLLLAVFLKMSAHPNKLAHFSPESENLKAHLIERLNAISETVP